MCIALLIYCIWWAAGVKGLISQYWPWNIVCTLLFGKLWDVWRHGPHGGKLYLLYPGWYVPSTWTKQNLHFDCHFIGKSNANHTTWLDYQYLIHPRFQGDLVTNITRHLFCRRIFCSCSTNMLFRLLFTFIYPCKQRNNIRPTYWKSWDGCNPLQAAAIHCRIHLELNIQVGHYWFHFDLNLTIYSWGLGTCSGYQLSLHFHTSQSCIHKHLRKVEVHLNRSNR
jgi:hypothetical protein